MMLYLCIQILSQDLLFPAVGISHILNSINIYLLELSFENYDPTINCNNLKLPTAGRIVHSNKILCLRGAVTQINCNVLK